MDNLSQIKSNLRNIPNFPKPGINFKDITTILNQTSIFKFVIDGLAQKLTTIDFDTIVAIESRGFIFASPLAYILNKNLVLVRKKGKLPHKTFDIDYSLEYGINSLSIHQDSLSDQNKTVIIDDLIATGGTAKATYDLIQQSGASVGCVLFFIELVALKGRHLFPDHLVQSLIQE
ncbi:adenine phosphoribosyltransferase [Candidatus Marinamargulisbacteria bacterium SCGC AG-410-N11]|nr:adenine phosphoribosyltransferase [Candidatus Marinamargulisbacteria bacterium SCGC AG-410-N11]